MPAKKKTRSIPKAPTVVEAPKPPTAWRITRATAPVAYVINAIEERIRSGQLAPGQRLIEADLCNELNVKRGPVREALRILAGDGILELVAQRGARVRRLETSDLREMMPVMAGLVAIAVRLSIDKLRTAAVRGELETHMTQMRYAARNKDLLQVQLAAMRYQETLQRAANNRFLDYLRNKMHPDLLLHQLPMAIQVENWKTYLRHFEQMHDALFTGNVDRAVSLVHEHERQLVQILTNGDQPAVWR